MDLSFIFFEFMGLGFGLKQHKSKVFLLKNQMPFLAFLLHETYRGKECVNSLKLIPQLS
jgi:hypothetical protein